MKIISPSTIFPTLLPLLSLPPSTTVACIRQLFNSMHLFLYNGYHSVVFQPPFYQYNYRLPWVVIVCNMQNGTRPARQSLVEVIRPSSR